MAFDFRPFEDIEFCLNRACTALAILIFRKLLHLFMMNYKYCGWTYFKKTSQEVLEVGSIN